MKWNKCNSNSLSNTWRLDATVIAVVRAPMYDRHRPQFNCHQISATCGQCTRMSIRVRDVFLTRLVFTYRSFRPSDCGRSSEHSPTVSLRGNGNTARDAHQQTTIDCAHSTTADRRPHFASWRRCCHLQRAARKSFHWSFSALVVKRTSA